VSIAKQHLWIVAAALLVAASPARAQGVGGRVGASVDPDQFYGGVHVQSGELADNLRFQPNLEIGVGDDRTLFAVNFEFTYRLPRNAPRLPASMAAWHLYVGGGPALNIYHVTDDTRSEGGFNGLIGLAHTSGLFAEAKIGAIRSPTFKFAVGYTFRP
jgi:hypothetical protein